jgi:peroxiredoxin
MKKILLISIFFLVSCENKKKEVPTKEIAKTEIRGQKMSLRNTLNEMKDNFNAKAPEEKKIAYEDGIKAVKESGVLDNAKNVGDNIPEFILPNSVGKTIKIEEELAKGPVVLTWYRGGWCPYCNLQLSAYQQRLDEIKSKGANLIAISPELPDNSLTTKEKHSLDFLVLTDQDNKIAEKFGIMFDLTSEVEKYYKKSFSFLDYYGTDEGRLPLAVTYVINKTGKITWAYVDPDYRNRAEPDDIIKALDALQS